VRDALKPYLESALEIRDAESKKCPLKLGAEADSIIQGSEKGNELGRRERLAFQ